MQANCSLQSELRMVLWDLLHLAASLPIDRKSTRLNSSHVSISYAVFCLKKKTKKLLSYALTHLISARCFTLYLTFVLFFYSLCPPLALLSFPTRRSSDLPGTDSPWHADPRLLAIPTSCRRIAAYNPN